MPEDGQVSGDYSSLPSNGGEKSTKYYTKTDIDADTEKRMGEKYIALQAEEEKTWWDHQTHRTVVALLISVVFIGIIAALVFLLPCPADEEFYESTTFEPNVTLYTELDYEDATALFISE